MLLGMDGTDSEVDLVTVLVMLSKAVCSVFVICAVVTIFSSSMSC